jgi:hypothetical protein
MGEIGEMGEQKLHRPPHLSYLPPAALCPLLTPYFLCLPLISCLTIQILKFLIVENWFFYRFRAIAHRFSTVGTL